MPRPLALLRSALSASSALLARVGLAEKSALLAMALTAALLYAFAELAEDMAEGDTRDFDRAVLLVFRNPANHADPIGPAWLEETVRDFTALGSIGVLLTVSSMILGFLVLSRKRQAAWMVALSVAGGIVATNLLKLLFARPRPDLVPHAAEVFSNSFPSGHATLSAVVYLTLGALLARTQSRPALKIYLLAMAIALTVTIGISRIYLGVHWPTDVLAGWAIGSAWALICWITMLWLQSRGSVEPPDSF